MLLKIVETKREEVQQLRQRTSVQMLLEQAKTVERPRGFRRSLLTSPRPVSVIAEVKKASPSKGVIRPDFSPLAIARSYAKAGAEAISVLTDQVYFQGSLNFLRQIHAEVSQPLLRKDFLIDEIQVVEARANGADCVLLIAAILEGEQLKALYETASSLEMDVLVEIHNLAELETVFRYIKPELIGINNRDLHTFRTDIKTTAKLIRSVPKEVSVVSESGISSPADIAFLQQAGARSVLVGEHFMRQQDVTEAVIGLVGGKTAGAERVEK